MGQRLAVTIHAFDDDIATVYYHWGAYTGCSLEIAKDLVRRVDWCSCKTKEELILQITRFLEDNNGGIDHDETNVRAFRKMFKGEKFKKNGVDGNYGLIAISESAMNNCLDYAAGELTIDYDDQMISNSCYNFYESIEDYVMDNKDLCISGMNFRSIGCDPTRFDFNQIDVVSDAIHSGDEYFEFDGGLIGPEEG